MLESRRGNTSTSGIHRRRNPESKLISDHVWIYHILRFTPSNRVPRAQARLLIQPRSPREIAIAGEHGRFSSAHRAHRVPTIVHSLQLYPRGFWFHPRVPLAHPQHVLAGRHPTGGSARSNNHQICGGEPAWSLRTRDKCLEGNQMSSCHFTAGSGRSSLANIRLPSYDVSRFHLYLHCSGLFHIRAYTVARR